MQRITVPPSLEEFRNQMTQLFFPEPVEDIMLGWEWCGTYHADQKDRQDGSPYADHPRAAAWILVREAWVTDPETITLALLHDVGEVKHRSPPTHQELTRAFGYRVAYKVRALTKDPGQDVADYSRQVFAGGAKAVIAKFGDRLHNLRTLGECDPDKQKRIIRDTQIYYDPFVGAYKEFFRDVSPRDVQRIETLWELMQREIATLTS